MQSSHGPVAGCSKSLLAIGGGIYLYMHSLKQYTRKATDGGRYYNLSAHKYISYTYYLSE